jgi:hypothetical protein
MNLSERLIVSLLTLFDLAMNIITFGQWEKVRGEEVVIIKTRKQN